MEFENKQSGNGGYIILKNEGQEEVGRLTYTIMQEKKQLIISYVLVHSKFEGRGMGKYLVEDAIKFARENGWSVLPHCSYARSVMRRMSDVADVFSE